MTRFGAHAWRLWLYEVPVEQRFVLLGGLTIRAAAVVMLSYVLPLVWRQLPHPGWSLLLAVCLVVKDMLIIGWWLARHRLDPMTVWLDLPANAAALVCCIALTDSHDRWGWLLFAYPYVVLISFGCGLSCRRLVAALGCGVVWGTATVGGLVALGRGSIASWAIALPYLINLSVGWGCVQLLRRNAEELEAAQAVAVREAADMAAATQRARLSTALHDRILQTLETLSRSGVVHDDQLHERVAGLAAWLRAYVESGRVEPCGDLALGLDAAARAAQQAGLAVQVNDARIRIDGAGTGLDPKQRDALVEAVHQTITAFGGHSGTIVVRAAPDAGGVLVTVLSTGGTLPDAYAMADARARLDSAGGWLTLDALPYAELWVPLQVGAAVAAVEPT